jgi:hypothetical protein
LIDTLAEIVFAQSRAAEAVRLEQDASRLDPTSNYYRQQIARFSAGVASSAPPASPPPTSHPPAHHTVTRHHP